MRGLNQEASERETGVHDTKRNTRERERERERDKEYNFFFFFGNYFCLVSEKN